jgi:copper(I)-binding protein
MRWTPALAPILAAVCATSALAAESPIRASHAWTRPAAAGGNAAGYVTLINAGGPDALVSAASPIAQQVELHTSSMAGGVMRMGAEAAAPIAAHGQLSLAPGGRHLMFIGLKRPLHLGDHAPAILAFKSGATVKVDFMVTAAAPDGEMQPMPGMH